MKQILLILALLSAGRALSQVPPANPSQTQSEWYVNQSDSAVGIVFYKSVWASLAASQLIYAVDTNHIASTPNATLDAGGNLVVNSIAASTWYGLPSAGNVGTGGFGSAYYVPYTTGNYTLGASAGLQFDGTGMMSIGASTKIGTVSTYAQFANYSYYGTADYALLQDGNGMTWLNTATGQTLDFRRHNVRLGYFDLSGTLITYGGLNLNGYATVDATGNLNVPSITASTYYNLPSGGGNVTASSMTSGRVTRSTGSTAIESTGATMDNSGNLNVPSITATTYYNLPNNGGNVTASGMTSGQVVRATGAAAIASVTNTSLDGSGNASFNSVSTSTGGITSAASVNGASLNIGGYSATIDQSGNISASSINAGTYYNLPSAGGNVTASGMTSGRITRTTGATAIASSGATIDASGNINVPSITATTYYNLPSAGGNVTASGMTSAGIVRATGSTAIGTASNTYLDASGNATFYSVGTTSGGGFSSSGAVFTPAYSEFGAGFDIGHGTGSWDASGNIHALSVTADSYGGLPSTPVLIYSTRSSGTCSGVSTNVTSTAGLYRVSIYYGVAATNAGGATCYSTVGYYQPSGVSHTLTGTTLIVGGVAGANYSFTYVVDHLAGNLSVAITIGGGCGSGGTFDFAVTVERLN